MNNDWKIKIGERVHVGFNNSQFTLCAEAEVLYIPCSPGDSWVFRDIFTHQIHYVSEGCTISKIN